MYHHHNKHIRHTTKYLMDRAGLDETDRTCHRPRNTRGYEHLSREARRARHLGGRAVSRNHDTAMYTRAGEPGLRTEVLHDRLSENDRKKLIQEANEMPQHVDIFLNDMDPAITMPWEMELDATFEEDEELNPSQLVSAYNDERDYLEHHVQMSPKNRNSRPINYDIDA